MLYAVLGFDRLRTALPKNFQSAAQIAGAIALILAPALSSAAVRPDYTTTYNDANFTSLAEAVRSHAAPQDLTIYWNARLLALAADRRASSYPSGNIAQQTWEPSSTDTVLRFLDRVRPAYVVWDGDFANDERFLAEAMARYPGRFDLVYQNPRFKLVRYNPN